MSSIVKVVNSIGLEIIASENELILYRTQRFTSDYTISTSRYCDNNLY